MSAFIHVRAPVGSSSALGIRCFLKECSTTIFCLMSAESSEQNEVCHLRDNPARCMNRSHQPLVALNFVSSIPRVLTISPAFDRIAWRMTGNAFACISLTKHSTASSTCGYLPFLGPVKHFVVALQENMEWRSLLQRQIFASLIPNVRPAALFPCFSAYTITFHFNAES